MSGWHVPGTYGTKAIVDVRSWRLGGKCPLALYSLSIAVRIASSWRIAPVSGAPDEGDVGVLGGWGRALP